MQDRRRAPSTIRALPLIVGVLIATIACSQKMNVGLDDDVPTSTPFAPEGDGGAIDAPESAPNLCVGTECPWPYADCPRADGTLGYRCGTNLLTDDANCGACGNVCPGDVFGERKMVTRCVVGECKMACQEPNNFGSQVSDPKNCNGLVDDGCETDILSDPDNCGACGNRCGDFPDGSRQPCIDHKCGCPPESTYCPGLGCVDLRNDPSTCGACGTECTPPDDLPPPEFHLEFGCRAGACGLSCSGDWGDCDGDPTNGCETFLLASPNCGACGVACTEEQTCFFEPSAPPAQCICGPSEVACGGGCTDLLSDPANCGACGHACQVDASLHVQSACTKGYCGADCAAGFGDCDGNPLNGCEADLRRDGANCGACGNSCDVGAGQPCIEGRCLSVECDAGVTTK